MGTSLQDWFKNYQSLSNSIISNKVQSDKAKMASLITRFNLLITEVKYFLRTYTPNYNIFYTMKYIVEKEEQLHSPFLADLLNIEGSHMQKDIFYSEFLEQISAEVNVQRFQIENDLFFSVELEKWIGNGEIDILISYNSPNNKFAIAIENKIYAKDQPDQLKRYALFLEREYKSNFLLLYLTPDSRLPEIPFSIEKEHFDRLVAENKLRLITYKKHVIPFLEKSLLKIGNNIASSNIRQYLQVIKNNFAHG